MSENVSFKVYLLPDQEGGGPNEVRRFVVDREVSTSFTYLQEKLATVFPSLGANIQFSVSWTDLDGDKVTIATDEELIIALTEMTGPVYKLSVTVKPGKRQTQAEGDNGGGSAVHPGVTCDACDKEIKGFRYKCVVCDDYDLCSTCEGAGKHPGHNMMRIASPEVIWPQRMFKRLHKMQERAEQRSRCRSAAQEQSTKGCGAPPPGSGIPPPPPGHGGPPPPPRHGPPPPPHAGAWFGGGRGRGMFRGGRGMHGMSGIGGGCGFGDQKGAWSPEAGPWSFGHNGGVGAWAGPAFDAMMRGWMGEQYTGTSTSTSTNSQTQGNQNQSAEAGHEEAHTAASEAAKDSHEQAHAAAHEAAYAAASAADATSAAMSGIASSAEYLQNVGNFVAAALDPLGIDVQVDIESADGTRNTVKTSSSKSETTSDSDKSMTPSDDEEEWTVVSEKKSDERKVEIPIQIIGQQMEKEQLYPTLPENTPEEEKNTPNTMEPPAARTKPVAIQSMTTDLTGTTSVASSSVASVAEVAAPTIARHPDPKIQVALQAMMNMGFSNEGGWLTSLIEAKNGDIGKVLDILQPVKK